MEEAAALAIKGELPAQIRERESLESFAPLVDMELDAGIRHAVLVLRRAGIETYESCSGEPGHAFCEPTVRFHGGPAAAYRAYAAAIECGLPVFALRPVCFQIENGQLAGPFGEITFLQATGED